MNRARTLAIVALLLSGCIPDTKKLDPLRSAAAVCPVIFDLLTAKMAECDGVAPYLAKAYYAGAMPSCDMIAESEKAGRIGYDRALTEGCVNALDAPGCGALNGGACDSAFFVPKVGTNDACVNDLECTAASAGCFSPDLTCPGHCLQPGGGGARCSSIDPQCGSNFYCDTSTAPATPTCRARATGGQPCASIPCVPGQFCSAALVCVNQLNEGTPCTGYGQCDETKQPPLFCDTAVTNACQKVPTTPSSLGGSCDYPYQCADTLWCDYSATPSTCKAKVPVPQACTRDNGCSTPGSACILDAPGAAQSHCRLLLTEGTACTPGLNACQRGLWCSQGAGGAATCARQPLVGGTCGTILGEYVSCGQGWCDRPGSPTPPQGICRASVAAGQPCPNYSECGNDGFGFTRTQCENVPGLGLTCVAPCPAF
jgi:hypothetical protein